MMSEENEVVEPAKEGLLPGNDEPLNEGEYFLSENIKGIGDIPDWYQGSRYKSVAEQAKGYTELEKKFGSFTGQPKEGYESPEGVESDDALLTALTEFATESNMNQEGFNKAWELLTAQNSANEEINGEAEIEKLGDNADARIKAVERFMKNNLSAEDYDKSKHAVNTAATVELVEKLIHATAPVKLPKDGGESPTGVTWGAIESEMFKKNEDGQLLRTVDREHEAKIQRMMKEWGGNEPDVVTVG